MKKRNLISQTWHYFYEKKEHNKTSKQTLCMKPIFLKAMAEIMLMTSYFKT